jgi:hypothetical protein
VGMEGTRSRRALVVGAIALGALVWVAVSGAVTGPLGSVKQVAGKKGCYTADGSSEDGAGTCRRIRGGIDNTTATLSPDHRFLYILGYGDSSNDIPPVLSIFHRSKRNGTLRQIHGKKGCFSRDRSSEDGPGTCKKARNLDSGDGHSLAISRNGRYLYTAGQNTDASGVTIFKRNLHNGTLRQLKGKRGCINPDGSNGCAKGRELDDNASVQLSPDQRFLYASNYNGAPTGGIAILRRNLRNGTLHQLKGKNGCITQDGTTDPTGPAHVCRAGSGLDEVFEVGTPDNRFVYPPNRTDDLVPVLKRNRRGGLVQLPGKKGCISDTGDSAAGSNTCRKGHGIEDAERVVPSKTGRFLYIQGYRGDVTSMALLRRNSKNGSLSEKPGRGSCISEDGSGIDGPATCQDGRALDGGYAGDLSADGRTLYYAEYGADGFVVLRVSPRNGTFHQLSGKRGCVTVDGSSEEGAGTCANGRSISHAYEVTVGPRGRDVYVATQEPDGDGVALFHAKR